MKSKNIEAENAKIKLKLTDDENINIFCCRRAVELTPYNSINEGFQLLTRLELCSKIGSFQSKYTNVLNAICTKN